MNTLKTISLNLIVSFVFFGCMSSQKQENTVNITLAEEFGVDSKQLVYQYYQKFGFTDVCEDLRMVANQKEAPKFEKSLPITTEDMWIINSFSNKTDKISESPISFDTNNRKEFFDVELDFVEYTIDSNLVINLNTGQYEISQSDRASMFKIYDRESGMLYVEVHRCDGE